MKIADRINLLEQSGLGLSIDTIAALLDIEVADLERYREGGATPPGAGGALVRLPDNGLNPNLSSTILAIPFLQATPDYDDVGLTSPPSEAYFCCLPVGRYALHAETFASTAARPGADDATPWTAQVKLQASGFDEDGHLTQAAVFADARYVTLPALQLQADAHLYAGELTAEARFQADAANDLPAHTALVCSLQLSATDEATSTPYAGAWEIAQCKLHVQRLS